MTDLHGEFAAWIAEGAHGDPARDVAVHASGCEACLRLAAAVDSLLDLDLDATPLPAMLTARPHRASRPVLITRAIAGVAVIILVVSAGAITAGGLVAPPRAGAPPGPSISAPAPAEGVLGGVPSSEAGSTAPATDSASPEASLEASPTTIIVETRRPAAIGLPQPTIDLVSATPTPRPATPRPVSAPPSPIVIPATASPSPAPTASPLPTEAPSPTPTASPDPACDPIDAGCSPSPGP